MREYKLFVLLYFTLYTTILLGQPGLCDPESPDMTPWCENACIVCDINGFSGRHQSDTVGVAPPGFAGECTLVEHNVQWIAFIAGSEDLRIELSVQKCERMRGLEFGLYKGLDCENFARISNCYGATNSVEPDEIGIISNTEPLTIGQYYYIVMDGAEGDNCNWTFSVLEGSTTGPDIFITNVIAGEDRICTDMPHEYSTEAEIGATLFFWQIDGRPVGDVNNSSYTFQESEPGNYVLCVSAANACNEAAPICKSIEVITPPITIIEDEFCESDCYTVESNTFCEEGEYTIIIELPNGCDSTINLFLDKAVEPQIELNLTICAGDTLWIGDNPVSTLGQHQHTLQTSRFCDSVVMVDLTLQDCILDIQISTTSTECFGTNTGSLNFTVNGGFEPYLYSWQHLQSGTSYMQDMILENQNVEIPDLPSGTYIITVEDDMGNIGIVQTTISDIARIIPVLNLSNYNGYQVSCQGETDGSVSVAVTGGRSPYSFKWETGTETNTIENLSQGTYLLTITDDAGCSVVKQVDITEPDELDIQVSTVPLSCIGHNSGVITLSNILGGVGGFLYSLNGSEYNVEHTFQNLQAGIYTYTVKDANGCTSSFTDTILEIAIPELEFQDNLDLNLGDSIPIPFSINIENVANATWLSTQGITCDTCLRTFASPLESDMYYLNVTSFDGCTANDSIYLNVNKERKLITPNIFSPNGDYNNDNFWLPKSPNLESISFKILDKWGNLIFYSQNSLDHWDGAINGRPCVEGVYLWIAEVSYIDDFTATYFGDITLIR